VALGALALSVALLSCLVGAHKKKHHSDDVEPQKAAYADYRRDVKPVLEARCTTCHGATRHKGGLRLDTTAAIRKGSGSGAVIVPGNSANSVLIAAVTGAEDRRRMPPKGEPLSAEQIALLKAWIDGGAPGPKDDDNDSLPATSGSHWAFRPPVQPPVPEVGNKKWTGNPIDAFLAAEQEKKELTPNPLLSNGLLLRRVCIDLNGLPPTREELRAFLDDTSKDAYEKAVDRLLASPRYGERWGRHWMDVWRYSDPDGRKAKNDIWWSNAYIWHWRDWIIQSLNADKGYDRMIVEMLAGDEVRPGNPEALAATGFLVRNRFKLNRNIWLNNTVEHTGKAFLGLTFSCARCHDHKFDPISQEEYYRFRAFFEPHDIRTDQFPVGAGGSPMTIAHAYDARPKAATWIFVRGDEKTPDKKTSISPGVPSVFGAKELPVTPIKISSDKLGGTSTGRRLALARWLSAADNPLTARVAVNHVWARHFGQPLVENVYDFGVRTPPPVQQPLLDWLAVEFMAHDWSLKWLHRQIVTSAAYRRQSSTKVTSAENLAADPGNQYFWRVPPHRMEAEVVRDALLHLAGQLEETLGGPPLDHKAGLDSARRSLYYRYSREDKMEFLTTFDAAGVEECYRRQESIVPQQALALENSEFVWDQARRMARRLDDSPGMSARAFVTAAFEHILGRAPEPAELEACEDFLAHQEKLLADPSRLTAFPTPPPTKAGPQEGTATPGLPLILAEARVLPKVAPAHDPRDLAREHLIHALLNHNDFVTVR
jgi:hypothetical protein